MSYSKHIYDKASYQQSINQSIGPGVYNLARPKVSCTNCYPWSPTARLQTQGVSHVSDTFLIDIDSDLSGITRKLSKNIMDQYAPTCPDTVCSSGESCGQGVTGTCPTVVNTLDHMSDCFFAAEDTRLTNPSCNLRGTGWNRWEWLHNNPQEGFIGLDMPFDNNINNRIIVKDNHRPVIPTPIDPVPALPKGGKLPATDTVITKAAFTQPTSVHWQCASNIRDY